MHYSSLCIFHIMNSVVMKSLGLFVFDIERVCRIVLKEVCDQGYIITGMVTYHVRSLYVVLVGCRR